MAIGDIDWSKKPPQLEIFLAKPNRDIVAKLNEAYGAQSKLTLGGINEVTFNIPYKIDRNHELVANKNIELIRERFLLKTVYGITEEWYIITKIGEQSDDSTDYMSVEAMSLPYMLKDKIIRGWKYDSKNATTILGMVLNETTWNVGNIDASFDIIYRSFDVSSKTALDFIFDIATTFQGVIQWDTKNYRVNLLKPENTGVDKGLRFNYGHYLKNMSKISTTDQMVTRLNIYGNDTLLIQGLNPTGQSYIEDFAFFLYPFERDVNRNVLKHSDYMTDGLCHAILDYKALITSKTTDFQALSTSLSANRATRTLRDNELKVLQTELNIILASIDRNNAVGGNNTDNLVNKETKEQQITAKKAEINVFDTQISTINTQISGLRTTLSVENNFTAAQIIERSQYIIEKEWTDYQYIDGSALLADAELKFKDLLMPQTIITINVVNFLQLIESQRDWNKLRLGDNVTISYDKMNINVSAKIIEVAIDHESEEITLTIANVKELMNDKAKFIEMLRNSASTSTTVDMSKYKWDGIDRANSTIDQIINNTWDVIKKEINAGYNESVSISERGIIIRDPNDPQRYLVAQHGVLALTKNDGASWQHAITPEGIVGERIFGKLLAGVNLTIDASTASGTSIFKVDGTGVTIAGTSLTITSGLPENQINNGSVAKWNSSQANAQLYTDAQLVTINNTIAELSNDGKLTGFEKQQIKLQWDGIVAEKTTIEAQATAYGITTERTAYTASYDALNTYLTPLLVDLTVTSDIVGATFRSNFSDYFSKRQILLKAISDRAVQIGVAYNGVRIDTANGLVITKSDNRFRAVLNATDGLKFQKGDGTGSPVWSDKFYYNVNTGNLVMDGEINAVEMKINGSSVLTADKLKLNGAFIDKISAGQIDVGTLTGFTIQTGQGVQRIQMDSSGFASYDASGVRRVSIQFSDASWSNQDMIWRSADSAIQGIINAGTNTFSVHANGVFLLTGDRIDISSTLIDFKGSPIANFMGIAKFG